MAQSDLASILGDGGRELSRLCAGLVIAVLLALLLAGTVPLVLLRAVLPDLPDMAGPGAPARAPTFEAPALPAPPSPLGRGPVEVARRYLGVPYVFGGSNPATGLDCSGLVQLVFRQLGIMLPRTAQLQYAAAVPIARDSLQPGDLVFFARTYADPHDWITHVGIYAGGGEQINAPTTGQVVSIQPVFSGFWGAHFVGGGRVVRP
ncbi:MAG TPA: C40 family peptidase [Chloroflexota bacterium]